MKRRDLLLATGAALGLSAFPFRWTLAKDFPKRRVLMFTRSAGFQHSVITRKSQEIGHAEDIFKILGRWHNIDVTVTKDGRVFDSDLDQYDAFFFYTTGDLTNDKSADKSPPMSADGKKRFLDAIAAGKGYIGSHCAADTFHSQGEARQNQEHPDPYIAMLGGEFISHGAQQIGRQRVVDHKFPGTESLGEALPVYDEWYALKNFAPNLHVLLVMETKGMKGGDYQRPNYPCTWAHQFEKGRAFYTSMGHREDVWTSQAFQLVLMGGVHWAVGNIEADVTPNVTEVTPEASKLS